MSDIWKSRCLDEGHPTTYRSTTKGRRKEYQNSRATRIDQAGEIRQSVHLSPFRNAKTDTRLIVSYPKDVHALPFDTFC
jgi:hypothetical protein